MAYEVGGKVDFMKKMCNRNLINVTEVCEEFTTYGVPYSLYEDENGNYYNQTTDEDSEISPFPVASDVKKEFKDFVESLGADEESETLYEKTMAALRGQADSIDYEWLNGYETEGTAADIVSQAKDHGEQITEAEAQEILEEYRNR